MDFLVGVLVGFAVGSVFGLVIDQAADRLVDWYLPLARKMEARRSRARHGR